MMHKPFKLPFFVCLTFSAKMSLAQVTYIQISDDTNSGIASDMTFTHAIDFGTSGTATVNGVLFANDLGETIDGRSNTGTRTYGPTAHGGNEPPAVSDGIADVFRDMLYNGPDPGFVELTGLTPNEYYDLRLYERAWDANATRTFSLSFDVGSDDTVEFTTPKINQNNPTLPTPGFDANVSYALSYKYRADANGSIRITVDLADDRTGTYHLYGLTNAVDPDGGSITLLSLDNSTFVSGNPQATLVGNLSSTFGGNADPATYSFVAGEGDSDNDKFQLNGSALEIGSFDFTGENSTDSQEFSIRIESVGTVTTEFNLILTIIKDDDLDTLNDAWEVRWAGDLISLGTANGDEDFDDDGLTDLDEFQLSLGTFNGNNTAYPDINPTKKDTDDDNIEDAEELSPTGLLPATDPTNADTDFDGLNDGAETNTGTYVSADNTGTDPTICDVDGDFSVDGWEVANGTSPLDANAFPGPVGPVAIVPITDDLSTDLDSRKSYTHLISGGESATINDVTFDVLDPATTPPNITWETTPANKSVVRNNNGDWDAVSSGVSIDMEALLSSFTYSGSGANPGSKQKFTLSNLTPGTSYDLRIYTRQWDTEGSGRPLDLVFTNGEQIVQPFSALPQDRPGAVTGSGNDSDAYYLTYQYTAQGTELVIDASVPRCAPGNSGSFHMYALSNEVASGVPLGQILITSQVFTADGRLAIGFKARPQRTYQVTKSSNLQEFVPLENPLSVTTDANGDGQVLIPAVEASEAKEFYRIEE